MRGVACPPFDNILGASPCAGAGASLDEHAKMITAINPINKPRKNQATSLFPLFFAITAQTIAQTKCKMPAKIPINMLTLSPF